GGLAVAADRQLPVVLVGGERRGVDVAALLVPGPPAQHGEFGRFEAAGLDRLPAADHLVVAGRQEVDALGGPPGEGEDVAGAAAVAGLDHQTGGEVFAPALLRLGAGR